jgi:hypothetical protein
MGALRYKFPSKSYVYLSGFVIQYINAVYFIYQNSVPSKKRGALNLFRAPLSKTHFGTIFSLYHCINIGRGVVIGGCNLLANNFL